MISNDAQLERHHKIRGLFDQYIEYYAGRHERLIDFFSKEFSGFAGGGSVLVKDREEWIAITRQDFAEVPEQIKIQLIDLSQQDLSKDIVSVTAFFHMHLSDPEVIFSREIVRLVLIFRLEEESWKIVHSSFSVPYHLVEQGEVFPLNSLQERNRILEELVEERTKELNQREAFYRLLTEDTLDVLWRTDANLVITYVSPSDERLRGFKSEEVIGHHVFSLFNEEGVAIVIKALEKRQVSEKEGNPLGFVNFEAPHVCKDGSVIWGEVFSKAVRDEAGNIIGFHGITREITKRKNMQDQIKQLAFYDTLTQLPNRRLLIDRINQASAASKRTGHHGALMFVDLDNFKPLNDVHGHHVGDLLLVEVAKRLKDCVREMDTVARFGGDEFVLLLGDLDTSFEKSVAYASSVAEKIRCRLSDIYQLKVKHNDQAERLVEHRCTASIGVYVFIDHKANPDEILKCADKAMYDAKAAGRNTIKFYQESA
ncbi:diguanylate cyclase domain-containing protein [Nitrincola schmidtii]|uniref:diguanylate cyclase domain-containing protein n=1 Tax=Nitrincola schmidtii TaxID=1730894 RepID=UPI00124EB9F2|nr:diguanylate cyclase [Nitrincola schmidtii]